MDIRKLLAISALALAGLAIEAAILHRFVAAPLASALRATRDDAQSAPEVAMVRPDLTEESEVVESKVVAPAPAAEPTTGEEAQIAGASR